MATLRKAVSPAPAGYRVGESLTGKTQEVFLEPAAVEAFCRMKGALRAGQVFLAPGCYIPAMDAVILPHRKSWPSRKEWEALRLHEWAHAAGWPGDHPNEPRNIFAQEPAPASSGNVFSGR